MKSGVDIQSDDLLHNERGEINFETNTGEGKYFPGGPKCVYNGKEIDCLTFASESGGISGDIFVKILQYFDKHDIFPREAGGPIPMLLVDGHQSRLDPKFINYINHNCHRYKVCLGVPYATTLWQVGDASEQNGKFKVEWSREKQALLYWKFERGLPRTINATDIIPLLNIIFHKSYGNIEANKKAVAERGWSPLNRKLLEHPSLDDDVGEVATTSVAESSTTTDSTESGPAIAPVLLNVKAGISAVVLDRLLSARARTNGAKKAAEERKRKGDSVLKNMKEAKRMTAGVMASNSVFSLNDPNLVEVIRKKQDDKVAKIAKSEAAKRRKVRSQIAGVRMVRQKHGHELTNGFASWNMSECGTYLQYKKQSAKDPDMPKRLPERHICCHEWMRRPSPTASLHASDNEEEGGDTMEEMGDPALAVAGLLDLALGVGAEEESNEDDDPMGPDGEEDLA